ncbi:MAG: penicillin acylase family protein [Pseudomonadota bacterium]
MVRRILTISGCLLAIAVILLALLTWSPRRTVLDRDAIIARAQTYETLILRDEWGVPHLAGETTPDAVFGLAYAHAEDDFATIQEATAATRGVLARYRGVDAAPTDYIVNLLGVWETLELQYDSDIPGEVKAIAQAYADGINLYAVHHPETSWPGLMPVTAQDVVAGFVFKTPFFYGLDETLMTLFDDGKAPALALDPGGGQQVWAPGKRTMGERGSNAFAVSPERSGDGVTRLVINSHQPLAGPVAWYEAHLMTADGLNILGGTFPGAPLILHGFTPNHGWANTVNKPDLVDVYRLVRNPNDAQTYQLDGDWTAFEEREITLRVGLFGPFALPVKRRILRSEHGPVIEAKHGTYAIRYAGMDDIGQMEQYYALNKAQDIGDFINAMALNALPSINYIYADKLGNILFLHNGQYPDRISGWDWAKVLPGDRRALIWQDYRPYDAVPILVNPESGFIWNANNAPTMATDGDDNLDRADFPVTMGLQTNSTNRSLRITELSDVGKTLKPVSRERLLAMKFDTAYAQGSLAREIIDDVLARDWSADPDLEAAAAHLRGWNFDTALDNHHAALGVLTILPEVTAPFTKVTPPDRGDAFIEAVEILGGAHGRLDVPWGMVNRLVRGEASWPVAGGPDILRAIYPAALRRDGTLHATAGDGWTALVEWDAKGEISAEVIHNYGSNASDPASAHYADQAPLFARQAFRRAIIDPDAVLAAATQRYHPLDRAP